MALEDKVLPQSYRKIDIDQYNYLRKKEASDHFCKVLLVILMGLGLYIYTFVTFNQVLNAEPDGFSGPLTLILGLIASTFVFIFLIAILASKNKRINNSSHLYTFKAEPGTFKIVENFSDSSVSVSSALAGASSQEVDEDGNPVFYAEEVFDDEDNIFAIEEASTLLKKEKSITYGDLIAQLSEALESYGVTGDLAQNLFAAMAFSKLIDVTHVLDVISILFKVLDSPKYVIHYSETETLTSQKVLANVFEYAKTHPNIPVFMLIDEIPSKEYLNYLRPLYRYIDDLASDYYITLNGVLTHIPHNVYFLSAIRQNTVFFDISRRYLRYIAILKADYKVNPVEGGERKTFSVTNEQLINARRNAMENYAVEESTFKKLDSMFNLANEANGYVLQNKIQRKIEDFCAVLLSLEMNEDDVIDRCLAYNIMPAVVISSDPTKLMKDYNLTTHLENEFGADKMKLTKAMIKDYLSLFNSKGERQNG